MPTPAASRPMQTPVQYTEGMVGRTEKGATLSYDGTGSVTLTRADGSVVFTKAVTELGKVRRAEFGMYLKVDGRLVFVMFGNPLKYIGKSAGIEAAGHALGAAGSIAAGYGAVKAAQHDNTVSGLEDWVEMFQAHGVMGLNASPQAIWKQTWKWAGIGIGVLFAIILVASALG